MNQCKIFYEKWQMECCGETVEVGDLVEWIVCTHSNLPYRIDVGQIDYEYEAHSSDWEDLSVLNGKVKEIQFLYVKYEEKDFFDEEANMDFVIDEVVGWELVDTKKVYGFCARETADLECVGYIVTMEDYTIRPAKEEEVTKDFLSSFPFSHIMKYHIAEDAEGDDGMDFEYDDIDFEYDGMDFKYESVDFEYEEYVEHKEK